MAVAYRHMSIPRRGRFYFAFGVGLIFAYWLSQVEAGLPFVLGLCFFLSAIIWFAFRDPPAGMEIRGGEWRFFVGHRHWTVPLRDVASVRLSRHEGRNRLVLRFRDGHVDTLPPALVPEPETLGRALAQRGIPLEA